MKFTRLSTASSGAILLASATLTHAATGLMDNCDPPDSSSNRFNESLTGFC